MKFAILSLLLTTFLIAEQPATPPQELSVPKELTPVNQAIPYMSLGLGPFPFPIPVFGVGYRKQINHHGFDLSLQGATIVKVSALKLITSYDYYFKPNYSSQFYIGSGVGTGVLFGHDTGFLLSPEFTFGQQYQNKSQDIRFFQAQISFPTIGLSKHDHDVMFFPMVILTYGIGF